MENILAFNGKSSDSSGISCVFATLIPIVPVWRKAKEYTDISRLFGIFLCNALNSDDSISEKREKGRRTN
ncbi:hypothetical protein [Lacrimispora celerecrescens]|uniref:hypothetical protein n=1 Tax=Lacrimispora celerecrescens TaxID=29354 RepID=UPI0012FE1DC4|nr:hypothetical protein [Lacrimispora celerecrescens]